VLDWIARIEGYKGTEARRNALVRALEEISDPEERRRLQIAASRIETAAVLERWTASRRIPPRDGILRKLSQR
jgi:hypothetical protein